jgi:hypothetical protein
LVSVAAVVAGQGREGREDMDEVGGLLDLTSKQKFSRNVHEAFRYLQLPVELASCIIVAIS